MNEEKQISNIEKVIWRIEVIFKNKLSDKNNFVLSYLNYLLKEKLDFISKEDDISISDSLKLENDKNEEIKEIKCSIWYTNQNWTCIKKEEST